MAHLLAFRRGESGDVCDDGLGHVLCGPCRGRGDGAGPPGPGEGRGPRGPAAAGLCEDGRAARRGRIRPRWAPRGTVEAPGPTCAPGTGPGPGLRRAPGPPARPAKAHPMSTFA